MNSFRERDQCKKATIEVERMTSKHLVALEEHLLLKKNNEYSGKCNCSAQFSETALEMVFDAIHHSVEYSNNASEMELFRNELIGAVEQLSCLINVWKEAEKNSIHLVGSSS